MDTKEALFKWYDDETGADVYGHPEKRNGKTYLRIRTEFPDDLPLTTLIDVTGFSGGAIGGAFSAAMQILRHRSRHNHDSDGSGTTTRG